MALLAASCVASSGCHSRDAGFEFDSSTDHFRNLIIESNYPDVSAPIHDESYLTAPLGYDTTERQPWLITVEDAVQLALTNSTVLRDLGGAVVRSPTTVRTIHEPAITETDPRFGIEAALSAFDAQLAANLLFEKNDFAVNNRFLGGGANVIQQDLMVFRGEISKQTATGTKFSVRHNMDYNSNNAPGNLFPHAWNVNYEVEARHPLMQGNGVDFNRIAGPNGTPGALSGVLLARIDTDKSIVDFEMGIRDLVNNVENAYWDLYYAYRDLESKIAARDAALSTWRRVQALEEADDKEAQAREQYFRFTEDVQNALAGRIVEGTRSNNGSSGGTFRGTLGVYVAERRLRLIMGVPINDGLMLRPAHDPIPARIVFDWKQVVQEALARRAELRRQMLQVKRRELELLASRSFLLPEVDAFGRYRWRGFGQDLLAPDRDGRPRFDNAYMDLTSGDFQEWQLGVEVLMPFGYRQAHAAVRQAQLQLARERAILNEQERQIVHDLSNALADINRAYLISQSAFNRRVAARKQLAVLNEREQITGNVDLNTLLDAQRRVADADTSYFRALVEYSLAIKNVHIEKGTLLEYNDVYLAESVPAVEAPLGYNALSFESAEPVISIPPADVPPRGSAISLLPPVE